MIFYLTKAIACSALLLGAYFLLCEKDKNHVLKRFFLLGSLLLSFVIPMISFQTKVTAEEIPTLIQFQQQQQLSIDHFSAQPVSQFNLIYLIYIAYTLVSFYFAVKFFKNLRIILLTIKTNEKISFGNYTIVLLPNPTMPHSFLNFIFLNKADYSAHQIAKEILIHEQAHIQQQHSLDILFLEFLKIFSWFNPFLNLYKKAIQTNHEFLADEHVIKTCDDITAYQYLLFENVSRQSNTQLTSPFNYLTTKKRLMMMTSNPSKKTALLKQFAFVLIIALTIFLFSERSVAQQIPSKPAPPVEPMGQGISDAEMKTYKALEEKYLVLSENGKYKTIRSEVSATDKATLERLFTKMSAEQQLRSTIGFVKRPKPLPKVTPTNAAFENFKKSSTYGVWIDGKKVDNTALNQYQASDFKQVFISKLYGKALKNKSYTHQLDLMTNSYYDAYAARAKANKDALIMITKYGDFSKMGK